MTAKDYAIAKHGSQKYGGSLPYSAHLEAVCGVLKEYGYTTAEHLDSAYLHDVLEDCCPTPAEKAATALEIAKTYGEAVASAVAFCTDAEGATRKERKAGSYARWTAAREASDPHYELGARVKLADRLANLRHCEEGSRMMEKYRGEAESFKKALHAAGVSDAMWAEYDKLVTPA